MSTIQITYSSRVEIDLKEVCDSLGVKVEHVKTITTTGNLLNIFMVNGSLLHYEFDFSMICDSTMDELNPTTKIV